MKRALLIVGGGAKGIVTAGMIKRLDEIGMTFDGIYGTSSGALNAAMYAQGDQDIAQLWLNISNKQVMKFAPWKVFGKDACLYDSKPLLAYLQKCIDPAKIVARGIRTTITVSNAITDQVMHFELSKGNTVIDPHLALLASASIPGLFPPVNGCLYDGGILDDYNLQYAASHGYDEIIMLHPSRPTHALIGHIKNLIEWEVMMQGWSNYVHQMETFGLLTGAKPRLRICIPNTPIPGLPLFDFDYRGFDRMNLLMRGYNVAKQLIG